MSRVYHEVASVLRRMDRHHKGVRAAFYNRPGVTTTKNQLLKQTFALVCNVSRNSSNIKEVLSSSKIIPNTYKWNGSDFQVPFPKNENGSIQWSKRRSKNTFDPYLVLVITWDFLLGQGIRSGGPVARLIRSNGTLLRELNSTKVHSSESIIHRYLRVNSTRISIKKALNQLALECEASLEIDDIVPGVIKINNNECISKLTQHDLLLDGSIVFQDRSSCLSALAAQIHPGMTILDACSAPGSKTLHCIDLLKGRGRVIAVERDPQRAAILLQRLKSSFNLSGPFSCPICQHPVTPPTDSRPAKRRRINNDQSKKEQQILFLVSDRIKTKTQPQLTVEIHIGDFLDVTDSDFLFHCSDECPSVPNPQIDVVLIDPSCSGSGLPFHEDKKDDQRIQSIASFQRRLLSHGLGAFPSATTICYSTCSIHVEENESVVESVLNESDHIGKFELCEAVPFWKTLSQIEHKQDYLSSSEDPSKISSLYDLCFHSHPHFDFCRGFFLSKICRTQC